MTCAKPGRRTWCSPPTRWTPRSPTGATPRSSATCSAMEHAIDMEALATHWDELPEREQRILVMRFYGNLTQAEIGTRLGISQMHVSRLLARPLGHLKSRLLDPADTDNPQSAATA